jgi:transposase
LEEAMHVMHARGAGLDVHQKTVVAWVLTPAGQATRTVGTMTAARLSRSAGLLACGCTPVAIESPGDDWKPGFNILEGTWAVILVKAQHVKAVPGRKTAGNEAAWLAELWPPGLLRARFIPPVAQRAWRDLTRARRTCIQARVTLITRVQKR